jgi:hypothetical protein
MDAFKALRRKAPDLLAVYLDGQDEQQARDAFRAAARAEREFLESLLPEGER